MNRRVQGRHCQRYAGDPTISRTESTLDKSQLRKKLRELRQSFSPQKQADAALHAAQQVQALTQWPGAQKIALYLDADGELGTEAIIRAALEQNKQVYLPVIGTANSLAFANWEADQPLVSNRFGIDEPSPSAQRCAVSELDILFMPLVAWDRRGNRLGMGGGYYDRALAGLSGPVLVGLAHSEQELETVPNERWDIVLDAVVSEQGIHHCHNQC